MASKTTPKPVHVYVTKTNHKKQPYTVSWDIPGPSKPEKVDYRYSTRQNARRKAFIELHIYGKWWTNVVGGKARRVLWTFTDNTKGK